MQKVLLELEGMGILEVVLCPENLKKTETATMTVVHLQEGDLLADVYLSLDNSAFTHTGVIWRNFIKNWEKFHPELKKVKKPWTKTKWRK